MAALPNPAAEILETVLLEVGDLKTVWASERISRMSKGTTAGSVKLQRLLWILPAEPVILKHNWTGLRGDGDNDKVLAPSGDVLETWHMCFNHLEGSPEVVFHTAGDNSWTWYGKGGKHVGTTEVNPLFCKTGASMLCFDSEVTPTYDHDRFWVLAWTSLAALKKHPQGSWQGSWRKMYLVRDTEPDLEVRIPWNPEGKGDTELVGSFLHDSLLFLDYESSFTLGKLVDDMKEQVRAKWGASYDHGL